MHEHVTNIRENIQLAEKNSYNMLIGPNTSALFAREFDDSRAMTARHKIFSRSDLLLDSTNWRNKYIMQLTTSIDCDSSDDLVRVRSVKMLQQEIEWANHLAQRCCVIVRLPHGPSVNLARHLVACGSEHTGCVLMHVPWTNTHNERSQYRAGTKGSTVVDDDESDPWLRWDKFRRQCDFSKRIKVHNVVQQFAAMSF